VVTFSLSGISKLFYSYVYSFTYSGGIRVVISVGPFVFTVSFEKLTSDLDFGMCMDHVNTSPWTESQGYGSRSRIRVRVF